MNQLIGSSVGKKCMMIVALAFSALAPPQSFAVAANADAIIEVERLHPYVENKRHRPKPASLEDHPCREWYAELLDATGDTFVELIRNGSLECIDDLEWISDAPVQIHVSREENIIAVARAIPEPVRAYDESTSIRYDNEIKRLLVFLRKAKDIHYWCLVRRSCKGSEWEDTEFYTIEPSSAAHIAVKSAIDAIIEHQFFFSYNEPFADFSWEAGAIINEYEMHELYLDMVAEWINKWNKRRATYVIFHEVMHEMLSIVYWGHRHDDSRLAFAKNRNLIHALRDFVLSKIWLETDSQWIMEQSTLELGRYTKYKNTANYEYVLPIIESVLNTYENNPQGKAIWLRLIAEIDYNDSDNCSRYGLCHWYGGDGFNSNFRKKIFIGELECPRNFCPADSITIHAQDLSPEKLELACRRLYNHGKVFHSMFATKCNPVSSDAKSNLDIFVFNDGRSCEDLESAAFGRHPDSCSGIYWEGDPRDAHEPARFVATEYTPDESPLDPELAIWNFEHEYAHYLDGRYNRYGPYRGDDPSIHWWTEGFAEYFAAEVSPHFRLPDFQTPYSLTDTLLYSGSIPTRYAHRHLAVRHLIENHREFVDRLLEFMRHGEYAEYTALMQTEAPKYEAGWQSWLRSGGSAKAPDKVIDVSVKPGINQLAVFWRPTNGASGYKVQWLSGTENFAFASQHVVGGGVISSHVIRGLKPGVQYAVRIIATRNYADDGPPSKIETGTPISDTLELLSEEEEASFDLPALFAAEGEMLAYAVEDSPQTLVAARIDGNQLVISPNEHGEEGVAIVTVTATAPDGFTMQLFFRVAVEPKAQSMLRGWRYWLLDPDKRD